MKIPAEMTRLKGYRFPREVVAYAVWAYHRFTLSTADVGDLLAERGVIVSQETVRKWVNRFGRHFADCIKRDRPPASDKWHLDKVVVPINGTKMWLWRAVNWSGDVLDILVQPRRNAKAAKRFLRQLIARFGQPRVVITDKLAAISNRSVSWPRTPTTAPTKGSITGSRGRTDRPGSERSSWAGSNRPGSHRDFWLSMIKSTPSFAPAAINSPQSHTATPEPTLSASGMPMLLK